MLVRVRATSLNYRDLMIATGRYGAGIPLPLIPLSDGAGEIVALGASVTQWKVGDRVAGTFFQNWQAGPIRREAFDSALGGSINGMLAKVVALSANGVIAIPSHLSFEEAATLPCAALTAWHALVTSGKVSAGQTVLLLGTGGVSIFALQFAKMHGARVILTSSSDAKLARAKALGADDTINYRTTPDWEKKCFASRIKPVRTTSSRWAALTRFQNHCGPWPSVEPSASLEALAGLRARCHCVIFLENRR